jgi:hypothetical protein
MKYEILYQNLLYLLNNRVPQHSKLVANLTEILSLEKEAVYRRLRQEVPFTFEEVAIISKEFNISLDSMVGVQAKAMQPFKIQFNGVENPIIIDYLLLEKYVQAIKDLTTDSSGELLSVTNILPQTFYCGFKFIYQFYYFKWRYYSVLVNQTKLYHEIVFPERLALIFKDIFEYSQKIRTSYFVLGSQLLQDFVNDVNYFRSIYLIKEEDVSRIKEELFGLLDYIENIAKKGYIDNPANEVFIYSSDTSVDTSYSYIDSHISIRFAMISSFIFNSVVTFDDETLKRTKHHIKMIIKTSTLLSVAGERQRILYFDGQRKIVEQL